MCGKAASPGGLARWTCGMLACFALVTVATEVAGWHRYQVLLALALKRSDEGEALVRADMWFGNLTGWWQATFLATMLLFILWLDSMRSLADTVWPQGQRRHRAWVLFGWLVPLGQLFIPKMFINDLWAAAQPAMRRRRGNPLLTIWWLTVLAAGAWATDGYSALKQAATAGEARQALRHVMLSDGLRIGAAALTIAVVWRLSGLLHHAKDSEASADAHSS
ncbi:DUF4328 domain-containing protein [Streptomyces sporangiiformans]|uniref:DUF4328 domain-containing protein n=2 Tax=Streptomyces sporangiiformans TaxID=2315329 RepID=A0A505DHE3_9ACTN|nr:DUF4328 domain-containing protein [Streptomyces sporangiiformans]